jgi:hypothetical protein
VEVCGHFENDSISTLRTTRSRFENDSISHPADTPHEFRLDFFAEFSAQKSQGGQNSFSPHPRDSRFLTSFRASAFSYSSQRSPFGTTSPA